MSDSVFSPVSELIKTRISCRSYTDQPISEGLKNQLIEACSKYKEGIFGEKIRLMFVDKFNNPFENQKLGDYGIMTNPKSFFLGAIEKSDFSYESFGYIMEHIVLKATDLGLGINAGHDLSLDNLHFFVSQVPGVLEVSIGHALIAEALYFGLQNVVSMYLQKLS